MAEPAEELRYTYADYLNWPEGDRIELIDGVPYMLATPLREHQEISGELFAQIYQYLRGKPCKVYAAPFSVKLYEEEGDRPEEVDTVLEPDITVVCDPEKLDKYGCHGAPDWVIEILSPSNRRHDLFVKYRLYEKAGVREYWVVDPAFRSVQVFALENGRFTAKAYQAGPGLIPSVVFPELEIDSGAFFQAEPVEEPRKPVPFRD